MTSSKPLWARPVCDPELPGRLRDAVVMPPAGGRARRWLRERGLARQPGRVIYPYDLDPGGRRLLARAQNAIEVILGSDVRDAGLLEADEPALRRHEWEIASTACRLRAARELTTTDAEPGSMTAAVLDAQRHALAIAHDAAASRVTALERYADQVTAADAARRDWHTALRQAGLNDMYLDLVARTTADELAVAEIDELRARAAVTVQVLRDSLREASQAAEVLALPPAAAS
jgi:hypothetical protein